MNPAYSNNWRSIRPRSYVNISQVFSSVKNAELREPFINMDAYITNKEAPGFPKNLDLCHPDMYG